MSTNLTTFSHYSKIDHWEKDEWGDFFMVDANGRRWQSQRWRGDKHYKLDTLPPRRKIVRTMRQNRKVIMFHSYGFDGIHNEWPINGVTMLFEDAAKNFITDKNTILSHDSYDLILELLLLE